MREIVPDDSTVFDFPEPELVTGRRGITTVPTQALYMMNSPFIVEHREESRGAVLKLANDDDARVAAAYQLMLARTATDEEVADGAAFLRRLSRHASEPLAAWTAFCQTLFASADSVTSTESITMNSPSSISRRDMLRRTLGGFGYLAFCRPGAQRRDPARAAFSARRRSA